MNSFLASILLASAIDDIKNVERFGLLQNFEYQLSGFIIVILILGLMAWMLQINAKLFFLRPSKKPNLLHVSETIVAPEPAGGIEGAAAGAAETPEVQAAIAAAVYATFGGGVRIVSLCPAQTARRQVWASEGRRSIFQSHQPKK